MRSPVGAQRGKQFQVLGDRTLRNPEPSSSTVAMVGPAITTASVPRGTIETWNVSTPVPARTATAARPTVVPVTLPTESTLTSGVADVNVGRSFGRTLWNTSETVATILTGAPT